MYTIYNLASKHDLLPRPIYILFGTLFHTRKLSEVETIYNLAPKYDIRTSPIYVLSNIWPNISIADIQIASLADPWNLQNTNFVFNVKVVKTA